jgi:undecaprenyl diphosphate synthase
VNKKTEIPLHVGLILDGNRRWAKAQGLPSYKGHDKGFDVFVEFVPKLFTRGVKFVSAYVFSSENWKRSEEEVSYLMNLFIKLARGKLKQLENKDIKIIFLGRRDDLSQELQAAMSDVEQITATNKSGTLALCLNYGGTYEIEDALKSLIESKTPANKVTQDVISEHMYAPEIPTLDIIVRTGGQHRLSNFMLWRARYAEFLFLDKYWPDVTGDDVDVILNDFASRSRRFGE